MSAVLLACLSELDKHLVEQLNSVRLGVIPIEAPQKHPVTVDYKEVKKVEEFNRALRFTGVFLEGLKHLVPLMVGRL